MVRLTLSAARKLCMQALVDRVGLPEWSANAITNVVVAAERDHAHSHGLFRLPGYVAAVLHGKVHIHIYTLITSSLQFTP